MGAITLQQTFGGSSALEAVTKQQAPYTQQDHYYGPYQSSHSNMASLHSYW